MDGRSRAFGVIAWVIGFGLVSITDVERMYGHDMAIIGVPLDVLGIVVLVLGSPFVFTPRK